MKPDWGGGESLYLIPEVAESLCNHTRQAQACLMAESLHEPCCFPAFPSIGFMDSHTLHCTPLWAWEGHIGALQVGMGQSRGWGRRLAPGCWNGPNIGSAHRCDWPTFSLEKLFFNMSLQTLPHDQ